MGEEIKLNLSNKTENFRSLNMINSGGLFTVKSADHQLFREDYSKNIDSEFFVKFNHIKITKVYFDKEKILEKVIRYIEWENPENLEFGTTNTLINILISIGNENLDGGATSAYTDNARKQYTSGIFLIQ